MTDEEIEEDIEADIETGNMPEEEPIEDIPEEPITEPKPEEEPCDPLVETCNGMRDHILDLSRDRSRYDMFIQSIDESKKIIPSERLDKIYDDAVKDRKNIDNDILKTFEDFTICAVNKKPPEEPDNDQE